MQTSDEPKKNPHQFLLDEAKRRVDEWRSTGGGIGSPMPIELWQIAINLLKFCSAREVAKTLRLDPARLIYKNKHGAAAAMKAKRASVAAANPQAACVVLFVELPGVL